MTFVSIDRTRYAVPPYPLCRAYRTRYAVLLANQNRGGFVVGLQANAPS